MTDTTLGEIATIVIAVSVAAVALAAAYKQVLKPLWLWVWRAATGDLAEADMANADRLARVEHKLDRLAVSADELNVRVRRHLDDEEADLNERRQWRHDLEARVVAIEACVTKGRD